MKICIGALSVGTVIRFQDVRDELRGDNVGVVTAQIVNRGKRTTAVRAIGSNKRSILQHHHAVEVVTEKERECTRKLAGVRKIAEGAAQAA